MSVHIAEACEGCSLGQRGAGGCCMSPKFVPQQVCYLKFHEKRVSELNHIAWILDQTSKRNSLSGGKVHSHNVSKSTSSSYKCDHLVRALMRAPLNTIHHLESGWARSVRPERLQRNHSTERRDACAWLSAADIAPPRKLVPSSIPNVQNLFVNWFKSLNLWGSAVKDWKCQRTEGLEGLGGLENSAIEKNMQQIQKPSRCLSSFHLENVSFFLGGMQQQRSGDERKIPF